MTVKTDAALALHKFGDDAGLSALIAFLSEDKAVVSSIRALAKIKNAKALDALERLKSSSAGRACMFNGETRPLNEIIDTVLGNVVPKQFPSATTVSSISSSNSGSKGGCFIATAVYGSYSAPEVLLLRSFRDRVLLSSNHGKLFVRLYYRLSPFMAKIIGSNGFLKRLVRNAILSPIVKIVRSRLN